jgi:7,8-dihydro-6-hydroxymethylpterin dimethyltransferase
MSFLSPEEIAAARPLPPPSPGRSMLDIARERMIATGQWRPGQAMGRRFPVGCVALEVTQRCNLDCTLCYLSETSEAVLDLPLEEVFRRIDMIHGLYGPLTEVQVTGGDPTLRKRSELVEIVRRIHAKGMRPSLFTNGIRATRDLLTELGAAGLVDVAFHVDTTQQRKGYVSESDLNHLRREYIERARGLKLSVLFNTTVHQGNFDEIPEVARFFVAHADVVRLASFQLQADTGRGLLRGRPALVTPDTVGRQIAAGAGAQILFDTPGVGHRDCNRYAMTLVANGRVHDVYDNPDLINEFLDASAHLDYDRTRPGRAVWTLVRWLVASPRILRRGASWGARKLWAMKRDLIAGRGRVHKLSFFIHNFMHACQLDRERIEACVFMAVTADGPISMCLHNAKRDSFILEPVKLKTATGETLWHPLRGPEGASAGIRKVQAKGRAAARPPSPRSSAR